MGLHRTPVTWAIYGANGAWAAFVYLAGPISPILTEDLGVSVASAGLVGTALAAGIATASATGPAAVRRLGRDGTIRLGLVGLAISLIAAGVLGNVFSGALGFGLVLATVWAAATGGGTVVNAATARLSDKHPEHSAQVITEANAAAGWVGLFSPLLLGVALGAGLGWWVGIAFALVAAVLALVGIVVADRAEPATALLDDMAGPDPHALVAADEGYEAPDDATQPAAPAATGTLPPIFWLAMVALFAAVGTEFGINFWGSTLVEEQTGVATATATSAMSAVVAGIAVGRTAGSAVTSRLGPHRMLLGGFALAIAGFFVIWFATALPMAIGGLFLAGLGLATLFPLVLDRGIVLSGGLPDIAMSRASLILGVAIGGAPFALGALGAVVPVATAMLLVPVFAVAGLVGVAVSRPSSR